jgi:enoyl-CoA hydratase/carnithine racemase
LLERACLTATHEAGVIDVVLHGGAANEIGTAMLADLEALVESFAGARALVIRSASRRGFCAGADLRELHRTNTERRSAGASDAERLRDVRAFLDRIHAVMNAIDDAPFTTIAATHGVVFGGGLELALACDLVVADKTSRFAFPELRLGVIPGFGGIPRLRRAVGTNVAADLLLTGRSIGAARAHELGLVSQVVADGQAPVIARRVAEQATRFDPVATRAALRFLSTDLRAELEREKEVFCELFVSPAVDAALARFASDESAMPYLPAGGAS